MLLQDTSNRNCALGIHTLQVQLVHLGGPYFTRNLFSPLSQRFWWKLVIRVNMFSIMHVHLDRHTFSWDVFIQVDAYIS